MQKAGPWLTGGANWIAVAVQDESAVDGMLAAQAKQAAGGWMDTIVNLIPGRKQAASAAPSDDAIKRTHEYLRWGALSSTATHQLSLRSADCIECCMALV